MEKKFNTKYRVHSVKPVRDFSSSTSCTVFSIQQTLFNSHCDVVLCVFHRYIGHPTVMWYCVCFTGT